MFKSFWGLQMQMNLNITCLTSEIGDTQLRLAGPVESEGVEAEGSWSHVVQDDGLLPAGRLCLSVRMWSVRDARTDVPWSSPLLLLMGLTGTAVSAPPTDCVQKWSSSPPEHRCHVQVCSKRPYSTAPVLSVEQGFLYQKQHNNLH